MYQRFWLLLLSEKLAPFFSTDPAERTRAQLRGVDALQEANLQAVTAFSGMLKESSERMVEMARASKMATQVMGGQVQVKLDQVSAGEVC